ncbi:uncharacterized protein SCHCODRAFT_02685088 [Schizophyllum commune H4-8]|nr:uncharacterized protein SCHCODRAFT_02685088 [Schizophyllum commune H4-8]KAI5898970.1 hypothetical protein SCHCODRAFT_02685088 [Schizophyllum commune H4-8]
MNSPDSHAHATPSLPRAYNRAQCILNVDLDGTGNASPAGPAPATSSSTRSPNPDDSNSLRRHIPGPRTHLAHSSRTSHDLSATNSSALDIIAHNTTILLSRTDDVLRAIEQTNGILAQGFERLAPAVPQSGIGLADPDVELHSLPPGLRPEPPEVVGQAAPTPISLPPDQSPASYGEGPHSLFDQPARVALAGVMRSPKGHQIEGEASDANDAHSEELAADRLTPSSSSLSSDLSHSPRTSLLSDDPSAPHSTPNASPEAEAGPQPGVFSADAGASSQGELPGPSSPMQDGSLPEDAAAQFLDGAGGGPSNALCGPFEQDHDLTHIHCHDVFVKEGPYIGRKLLIRVGKKSQLQDSSSQPFSQGVNTLLGVIEARRHDLTQLQLELHQVLVSGGTFDGGDALESLLYAIRPYLHLFFICSVSFKIAGALNTNDSRRRSLIAGSFSRLAHLRVEGEATATRLDAFPLANLCSLEFLTHITEDDVMVLLMRCSEKLHFLAAGPIDQVNANCLRKPRQNSREGPPPAVPTVMHIKANHACTRLLDFVPRNSVELHLTLYDARLLFDLPDVFGAQTTWTVRLE